MLKLVCYVALVVFVAGLTVVTAQEDDRVTVNANLVTVNVSVTDSTLSPKLILSITLQVCINFFLSSLCPRAVLALSSHKIACRGFMNIVLARVQTRGHEDH